MLTSIALLIALGQSTQSNFTSWGLEIIERIQADLLMPDGRLYGEKVKPGERPAQRAFNWAVGVMLPALDAAAEADPKYKPRLADFVEATRAYWNLAGRVPGYDVLPGPKKPDRYYDDNEWMVLGLVEASDVLGSKEALDYAEQAYRFVASGEDRQLGGGIFWREASRTSKNTCSNAPAAAGAIALYRKTRKEAYFEAAERIYAWTREHLRDPEDGLYWDNIALNGKISRAKFSYNSGLMLRDAAELYYLTKGEQYAADAREIQAASLKRWVRADGSLKDGGKFIHLLLENWLRAYRLVPKIEDPRPAVKTGLTFLHEHCIDSLGHYGDHWDKSAETNPRSPFYLIDQAAAARAYLEAGKTLVK